MEGEEKSTSAGEKVHKDSPEQAEVKQPPSTSSWQAKRKLPFGKILIAGIVILITVLAFGFILNLSTNKQSDKNYTQDITSYEECVEAGYYTMGIFPNMSCRIPGEVPESDLIFYQDLTEDEIRKELYSEELGQGRFTNNEYSFEFPTDTFELAYLACNYPDPEPALINKSAYNEHRKQNCTPAPHLFDVIKVDEIDKSLSNTTCYSTIKEQISIGEIPATSYTAKFIGGDIEKCTERITGKYSDADRLIYVKNENQLYLLTWPLLDYVDQKAYEQILATFNFVNTTRTERVFIQDNYWFDITIPPSYIMKVNKTPSLTKEAAEIKNEKSDITMKIVTNAGGEETRIGKTNIDGVPFYINYSEEIRCLSDLGATNWIPGTKPIFNIQIICDQSKNPDLGEFKQMIYSLKFSSSLKKVLNGDVTPPPTP